MSSFQPGDKAYVEVTVQSARDGEWVRPDLVEVEVSELQHYVLVPRADLLPVQADDATIERVAEVAGHEDYCHANGCPGPGYGHAEDDCGDSCNCLVGVVVKSLAAAGLLAGVRTGRSEVEVKAEALKTGDVADVTLTVEIGDEEEDWIAVGPAGDAWPDVDGWWIPRAMIHRATDPLTARAAVQVTGTEGGE